MAFRDDRRGAALQVGAVLLLGFLVISLSLIQAEVIPEENKRVEFKHNQAVQNDLLKLRNALLSAGTSESVSPVSIDMGTTYPPRVFFINPPPPGGLLRAEPTQKLRLSNVNATNAETQQFLHGNQAYRTKNISYRPGYNVYQSAPKTTYQSGVTVNEFETANDTAISGQTLIQENRIYLVAIAGNISQAQVRSLSVDPQSLSTSTQSTPITNTSGGQVTITIPTTLHEDRWKTLLASQMDDNPGENKDSQPNRYVTDVAQNGSNAVDVTLEANKTYRLRTALVGVGVGGTAPGPAYLTTAEPNGGADVAVVVRDKFNNPVPNSKVNGNLTVNVTSGTNVLTRESSPVGEDGRATFIYTGEQGTATLTLEKDGKQILDTEIRNVTINVGPSDLPNNNNNNNNNTTVNDDGAGQGEYTDYRESNTVRVDQPNGLWDNVNKLDSITMQKMYIEDDRPFSGKTKKFKLDFEIRNRNTDVFYTVKLEFEYDWDTESWDTNKAKIERKGPNKDIIVDLDSAFIESELNAAFLLNNSTTGDFELVGNSSYQTGTKDKQRWSSNELSEFKNFAGRDTYIIFTEVKEGSIEINIT